MPQSTEITSRTPRHATARCRRLQPVAVAQALGDEVHDVGAEQLERRFKMTVDVTPSTS